LAFPDEENRMVLSRGRVAREFEFDGSTKTLERALHAMCGLMGTEKRTFDPCQKSRSNAFFCRRIPNQDERRSRVGLWKKIDVTGRPHVAK
jgi:hypothetical protein